jgi:hypothetical protein
VPHTTAAGDAPAALAELRRLRGADPAALAAVRDVVVVASSSRGGSSMVGELLRRAPGLVHLSAEINPLFVAAGLCPGRERAALEGELAADLGVPAGPLDDAAREDLCLQAAWRLVLQWPQAGIDVDAVRQEAGRVLDRTTAFDRATFMLELLAAVPAADPWYYDVPAALVAERFPRRPVPDGPPGEALVEMPPFVLPRPWRRASAGELAAGTVVLTTPRNSYRLPFLRSLFPNARLRVVHLVRNPAAAVNGLVDGWLHRGFFNVAVDRPLRVTGYSDRFPWGDRWWNYDFPPDWESLVDRPLALVGAAQWRSTHEAALAAVDELGLEVLRLRFEDLTGPADRRAPAVAAVADYLGLDPGATSSIAEAALPPVMATEPPRPGRWRGRAGELAPVLQDRATLELAERLGYEPRPDGWE